MSKEGKNRMFGLNETAVLYARTGQSGGKPVYAERGIAFCCRSEPVQAWSARGGPGGALERDADTRIFARGVDVNPGDRIELGGRRYCVTEVKRLRGLSDLHHLEIAVKEEGA